MRKAGRVGDSTRTKYCNEALLNGGADQAMIALHEVLSKEAFCEYVGAMALELQKMTQARNLGFLSYLLNMVGEEAIATSRRVGRQAPH